VDAWTFHDIETQCESDGWIPVALAEGPDQLSDCHRTIQHIQCTSMRADIPGRGSVTIEGRE
jgi:hypothetical protein